MPARIAAIRGDAPEPALVDEAVRLLLAGRLVVLPTETVYGLCADPRAAGAMDRLYAAKARDPAKPVALLIDDPSQVGMAGAFFHPSLGWLAERFWPGPLTLVLDTPEGPAGFRCPDHPVPLAVLRALGAPLSATSANRSGRPDARTASEAMRELGDVVDLILDGGPATGGRPSSVVRLYRDGSWSLLREGAIPRHALQLPARLEVAPGIRA